MKLCYRIGLLLLGCGIGGLLVSAFCKPIPGPVALACAGAMIVGAGMVSL